MSLTNEQVKSALSEIPELFWGGRGVTVSVMIVAVYNQPGFHENFDETRVPSDVLAETMRDLYNAP